MMDALRSDFTGGMLLLEFHRVNADT